MDYKGITANTVVLLLRKGAYNADIRSIENGTVKPEVFS